MTFPVVLAVIAGSCLLVGVQLAHPQAKNEAAEKISQIRRSFPLSKFYDTPSPLPSEKPGDLIRSQEFDQYDLPFRVVAVRILYHSRSADGRDVAASGVVLYPDGKAPPGGWPVIAWAHALNGVARQCAPSLARNVQHGPFLSMYVALGYAVVATDYTGLGTSFRDAFTDMLSNATDVIYSVPAAQAAVPLLGSRWVAVGIGQGGPTVAAVAELENEIRDPNYLGSIAISGLDDLPDYEHSGAPAPREMPLLLAYGIKTVYPDFTVKDILTDKGLALYPRVEQACGMVDESKGSPDELLKPSWASNKFVQRFFSRNILGQRPGRCPVLVISSELDPAVSIQRTKEVIARMCKQGDRIEFERYPLSEPGSVFGDSVRDQITWIQARFSGRPAASNCSEQR